MSNDLTSSLILIVGGLVLLSVPALLAFVFIAANKTHRKKLAEWNKLPTLDEYLAQHPGCETNEGPACNQCQATGVINRGMSSPDSKQRILSCENCHTPLFRAEM